MILTREVARFVLDCIIVKWKNLGEQGHNSKRTRTAANGTDGVRVHLSSPHTHKHTNQDRKIDMKTYRRSLKRERAFRNSISRSRFRNLE